MEDLEGADLGALLARHGRFELSLAVAILLQVLESLIEAHGIGIVHRDLKPENIFVARTRDGSKVVKVLDFGIARAISGDWGRRTMERLTQAGMVCGTPAFMAPEQATGEPDLTPAVDVYALGGIAYLMLTGHLLYDANNAAEMALKHVTNPIPRFPEPLEGSPIGAVLRRALAKEPERRFRSALEFKRELEDVVHVMGLDLELTLPARHTNTPILGRPAVALSERSKGAPPPPPPDTERLVQQRPPQAPHTPPQPRSSIEIPAASASVQVVPLSLSVDTPIRQPAAPTAIMPQVTAPPPPERGSGVIWALLGGVVVLCLILGWLALVVLSGDPSKQDTIELPPMGAGSGGDARAAPATSAASPEADSGAAEPEAGASPDQEATPAATTGAPAETTGGAVEEAPEVDPKKTARLVVLCRPATLDVFIGADGPHRCGAPIPLEPGSHTVQIRGEGREESRPVQLKAKQRLQIAVAFE